eukprot:TRINITY_DN1413_c0_g1_i6.p1 TRINITY_DN1413_c0_g1~~TRINITY_DN1413_c0_g1_i6.p1  ORF type:complete len:542 (+),score=116.40 TRINITY_DN1413_c0_g1_i6:56-1681(+)
MGRTLKVIGGATGTTFGALTALGYYDEGFGRTQTFWSRAFPIFLRYRWVQFLNRDMGWISDEEASTKYQSLHDSMSVRCRDLVYSLRGFYLKNAQMMSGRDDFFPEQYLEWMKETQDQAPTPFDVGEAERIVADEFGKPIDEVFSFFDPTPTGVASIGQVHRAILKSNGKEVAVKVQHGGAERLFRNDLATSKTFCVWFMPQHVPVFDEMEKQFLTEFDYAEEAKNVELIRKNIMPKWSHKVQVPQAYLPLCTKKVLVMDYLHGRRLVDGVKESYSHIAKRMGKTLEELEAEQNAKRKAGKLKLRSIKEEAAHARKLRLMITVGDYFKNSLRLLANATAVPHLVNYIKNGQLKGMEINWTPIPLDMGEIMDTLIAVHGDQLFTHGAFNGDPHPGNVLLLTDGRLGLIDFGQVKKLTIDERKNIAKVMLQLESNDVDGVAGTVYAMGGRSKYSNKEVCYKLTSFWLDRDTEDIMTVDGKVLNIADFLDAMEAKDPVGCIAESIIMSGRMLLLLRGLAMAFGMQISMAQLLAPKAQQFLDSVH